MFANLIRMLFKQTPVIRIRSDFLNDKFMNFALEVHYSKLNVHAYRLHKNSKQQI